jgi:hypothetical protein
MKLLAATVFAFNLHFQHINIKLGIYRKERKKRATRSFFTLLAGGKLYFSLG